MKPWTKWEQGHPSKHNPPQGQVVSHWAYWRLQPDVQLMSPRHSIRHSLSTLEHFSMQSSRAEIDFLFAKSFILGLDFGVKILTWQLGSNYSVIRVIPVKDSWLQFSFINLKFGIFSLLQPCGSSHMTLLLYECQMNTLVLEKGMKKYQLTRTDFYLL